MPALNGCIYTPNYAEQCKNGNNYAQLCLIVPIYVNVGTTGFEPATPTSRTWYATGLRYIPSIQPENKNRKKITNF